MNRFTDHTYHALTKDEIGMLLMIGVGEFVDAFNTVSQFAQVRGQHPNYKPFLKYITRKICLTPDGRLLDDLKISDPYGTNVTRKFANSFSYAPHLGGFVPMYTKQVMSHWFKKIYDEKENKLILECWDSVKDNLCTPDGNAADLIHSFKDQHVYFMRNHANDEIKIGISIHPEIRRRQIERLVHADVSILRILPSGGRTLETELHEQFKDHRVVGEWFNPAPELLEYINAI